MNDQPARYSPVCTWIGQGEGCSHTATSTSSYCEGHWPRVYQAGSALRTRHRDLRRAHSIWDAESEFNAAVAELEEEGWLL